MRQGLRVLLVEDDDDLREITDMALSTEPGWHITAVASGQEAVEVARNATFDVAVIDLLMPGMGGRETAAALRSLPGPRPLPVVFATGLLSARDEPPLEGCLGVIAKPYDPLALSGRIRSLLDAHGALP